MKDLIHIYESILSGQKTVSEDVEPETKYDNDAPAGYIYVEISSPFDDRKAEKVADFFESQGIECNYIGDTSVNLTGADIPFDKGGTFHIKAKVADRGKLNSMIMAVFNDKNDAYKCQLGRVQKALLQYVVEPDDEMDFEEAFSEEIEKYDYTPGGIRRV